MRLVTPGQMRNAEEASEAMGVSRSLLMTNAGKALAGAIKKYLQNKNGGEVRGSVVFLAGSGNNGGDCFAAAECLSDSRCEITVILTAGEPKTGISLEHFERLNGSRIKITDTGIDDTGSAESGNNGIFAEVAESIEKADVLVDGVFGTGFHGRLDEKTARIFAIKSGAYRIAADVPSGGNCRSGGIDENAFRADETVTFGSLKTGMTQYPLRSACGRITVADIGIPEKAYKADSETGDSRVYLLSDKNTVAECLPERPADSYKNRFGRLLVIAGSSGMRGAAALSVSAALRSGVGLISLASVSECVNTVSVIAPESMFLPLRSDASGFLLFSGNKETLAGEIARADAVLIGCGMGCTPETRSLTRFVVENSQCPVVIDADGINCIASDPDILLRKKSDMILTPHPGEMGRLTGRTGSEINGERIAVAEEFAERYDVVVLLKGAGTVIASRGITSVNPTGNPGMSRGGSGDVLSGIVASFAAGGADPHKAAAAAAYVHGLAGDIVERKKGMIGMLPRDIIDSLPEAFEICRESPGNESEPDRSAVRN